MNFVSKLTGSGNNSGSSNAEENRSEQQSGGDGGGFMSKMNNMAGGGAQGEKDEDFLDKGLSSLHAISTLSSLPT